MADAYKILAQLVPSATTLTTLYTVPAATSTAISSIVVCNRGTSGTTFRISVAVAGAADATKQYLYYDVNLPGGNSFVATIGISMATTDLIRVYAGNANLSFNLFGVEIT